MKWIGVFLVAPRWGTVSTQLFLKALLAIANFFINLLGFVKGAVPRVTTVAAMRVTLVRTIKFFLLLYGGNWLLTEVLPFGQATAENVVYWVYAGLAALFMVPQVPVKARKLWRKAMIPESPETDLTKQQAENNPERERPLP